MSPSTYRKKRKRKKRFWSQKKKKKEEEERKKKNRKYYVEHLHLLLNHFVGIHRGRDIAAKGVGDEGVELGGEFIDNAALFATLQLLIDVEQDLVTLGDLRLADSSQGHLLHINLELGHGSLEHVLVEDELHEILGRGRKRRGLNRGLGHRGRGLASHGSHLGSLLLGSVVVNLDEGVLARNGLEVVAAVPAVLGLVPELAGEILDGRILGGGTLVSILTPLTDTT